MDETITVTVGEGENPEEPTTPTGITLSQDSITLTEGETKKITATVTPSGASQEVIWESRDTSIVTVDQNGNITAVGEGQTTIVVTTKDGTISKELLVTVEKKNTNNGNNDNQNNGQQGSTTGEKEDTTTANKSIPQTGENIGIILIGLALLAGGIIVLIKYKKQ